VQRLSVLKLAVVLLLVVGVGVVVAAIAEGSVALVLVGVGIAVQAMLFYLVDRRAQAVRKAVVEQVADRLARSEEAIVRQVSDQLARAEESAAEKQAQASEHLDRLGVRMDAMQRRVVASIDAARLEASQRAASTD
jgi:hypothetical protein